MNGEFFFEGAVYKKIFDPCLRSVRRRICHFVEHGSSAIDLGCGTGALAFALTQQCKRVVGIDSSWRMIDCAQYHKEKNNFENIDFRCGDVLDLSGFQDKEFDYAVLSMFLHQMPLESRREIIREAQRIAKEIIIADYFWPQNIFFIRLFVVGIELMMGREHFTNFRSFIRHKGLTSLLLETNLFIKKETSDKRKVFTIVNLWDKKNYA